MAYRYEPGPHPKGKPLVRLDQKGKEMPGPHYEKKGKDRIVRSGTVKLRWNEKIPELRKSLEFFGVRSEGDIIPKGEVSKALKHANLFGGADAESTKALINIPSAILELLADKSTPHVRAKDLLREISLEEFERD